MKNGLTRQDKIFLKCLLVRLLDAENLCPVIAFPSRADFFERCTHDVLAMALTSQPCRHDRLFSTVSIGDVLAIGLPQVSSSLYPVAGARTVLTGVAEVIIDGHILAMIIRSLRQLIIPSDHCNRRHNGAATGTALLPAIVDQLQHQVFIDIIYY